MFLYISLRVVVLPFTTVVAMEPVDQHTGKNSETFLRKICSLLQNYEKITIKLREMNISFSNRRIIHQFEERKCTFSILYKRTDFFLAIFTVQFHHHLLHHHLDIMVDVYF